MRLTAIALLLLASAASADRSSRVEALLAWGEKALVAAQEAKGSELLRALEAAKPHFRRARSLAWKGIEGAPGDAALLKAHSDATGRLVAILNAETSIHLERGARSLARKRNEEALSLLPKDAHGLLLKDTIEKPEPYEPDVRIVDTIRGARPGAPAARTEADRRIVGRRGTANR
ncbi:MAG: hypothetical protein L6Q95_04230 [Planctomycetes bacterium]|nr:hypothetical protein [Planctomycetota bacterium]